MYLIFFVVIFIIWLLPTYKFLVVFLIVISDYFIIFLIVIVNC